MAIRLLHGDCLERMGEIEAGSVDMVLCDPPYGTICGAALRGWDAATTGWDTVIDQTRLFEMCNCVMRMNGALLIFAQHPYTMLLQSHAHGNLPFAYRFIWKKDSFGNALIAKVAPVKYTEDICVFFKKYDTLMQHPLRCYASRILSFIGKSRAEIIAEMGNRKAEHFFYIESTQFGLCPEDVYRVLIETYGLRMMEEFLSYEQLVDIQKRFAERFARCFNLQEGNRFKSDILKYKKDYTGLHPTQKPILLMRDLIKTYTNEGDTVLDFAMGSGTTGVACKQLGRNFIGIELDDNYFKIARNRIEGTDPLARELFPQSHDDTQAPATGTFKGF